MTTFETRKLALIAIALFGAVALTPNLPWLAESSFSGVVLLAWTRPSRRAWAGMIALALALLAARLIINPALWGDLIARPRRFTYFFGWASIALLAREAPSPAFTCAVAIPLAAVLRWLGVVTFGLNDGPTADGAMYLLDRALGGPSYIAGRWVQSLPWLDQPLTALYLALMWTLPFAYGASLNDAGSRDRLLASWIISSVLILPFYLLIPVAGPAYAFHGWPEHEPLVTNWGPITTVPYGLLRTGMPSLHLTWALLVWVLAPPTPAWLRPTMLAYVLVTVATTIGLGQHWLGDLIAALPFTGFVIWLTERVVRSRPNGRPVDRLEFREVWPYLSATVVALCAAFLAVGAMLADGRLAGILAGLSAILAAIAVVDVYRIWPRPDRAE